MDYELFDHTKQGTTQGKKIYLVDMTKEATGYFSDLAQKGIQKVLRQGKRVGIILNKKGFSSGVLCQSCGYIPQCRQCDVSVAYHRLPNNEFIGLCHICKTQYDAFDACPQCGKTDAMKPYGLGIQKAGEMLWDMFGVSPLLLDASKVNSFAKLKKLELTKHQLIVGTELLTTPIQEYDFDLLVYLDADVGLNIPDFAAVQRNFRFLYDGLSRHRTPHFIVQSYNCDHYSVRSACALDPVRFAKHDDEFRCEHDYPPYGQICVLRYKHEVEERLHTQVSTLYKELLFLQQKYTMPDLEIYTTPPLVYRIYGKYRYHVILKGKNLRQFMEAVYTTLRLQQRGFKIDRDATSLV